jgi:hypothetical protein
MARGWDSKSVEEQIDAAEADKASVHPPQDAEMATLIRHRRLLELSRSRVLQQLRASTNERHRQMLESALADLEKQIADLSA